MPRKKTSPSPQRLLRSLNLIGLDHLDPVILTALADERPLLLIGPHGTAKSELLNRLASVLGLDHRHYNASLIAFDDLLGYPVPNAARDGLTYLRTPGDLWEAESVFLDEISRCRPETQNKLFSIVHEKRVQGLPLTRLTYRWAAMNPPPTAETPDDEIYEGSLPLDPALADRFSWVVPLPTIAELSNANRLTLLARGGELPENQPDLARLVRETRETLQQLPEDYRNWSAAYVNALIPTLLKARLGISGRRAVHLTQGILVLYAATQTLKLGISLPDAASIVLRYGLPQRAQGRTIPESKLKAIHNEAVHAAGLPKENPWHQLHAILDPVARLAAALPLYPGTLDRSEISRLVSDIYAGLSKPRQYLLARHVLPVASQTGCLNVPTFELLSEPGRTVQRMVDAGTQSIIMPRSETKAWDTLIASIRKAQKTHPDADALGNTLLTLHAVEHENFDPLELIGLDATWNELFTPLRGRVDEAAA